MNRISRYLALATFAAAISAPSTAWAAVAQPAEPLHTLSPAVQRRLGVLGNADHGLTNSAELIRGVFHRSACTRDVRTKPEPVGAPASLTERLSANARLAIQTPLSARNFTTVPRLPGKAGSAIRVVPSAGDSRA